MRSLVTSIFRYAYEFAASCRIQAGAMRFLPKILHIFYLDYVSNVEISSRLNRATDDLAAVVKRETLKMYGHINTSKGPAKSNLQGTDRQYFHKK
ncbi:hypothetical protein PoB_004952100 [Plakobranchus ocellatus]|uniref:Uncharacterized protein n=1 Tax=Plakobranchus ocellatus TaxID=259542 RepID=A0AAV4BRB2_9GAST|nr:hypothetical protein PoB_004952100 [Plakobranchus ocellatus]